MIGVGFLALVLDPETGLRIGGSKAQRKRQAARAVASNPSHRESG